jgi:protein ImuB
MRRSPGAPPVETPLVTMYAERGQRWIAAVDAAASGLGLYPGMKLAQAQAMIPGLVVMPADPAGDGAALARLAAWCLRYAPLTAPDPPDGVWIDVAGVAHLHGGEAALLDDLLGRLHQRKIAARGAVADTPGAAAAVARYGQKAAWVLPSGQAASVLSALPVAALRLPAETLAGLSRLGFEQIGALEATARAPLARRFGARVLERLDQAFGRRFESIEPVQPPEALVQRCAFAETLSTAEAFSTVIAQLSAALCRQLEQRGQGARRLDLRFERVDGSAQTISIGTARPARHPTHLARLLDERLEQVDPGAGVEAMCLLAALAEPLAPQQAEWAQTGDAADVAPPDLAELVDRLDNRLGAGRVYRAAPLESDVPERSVQTIPPLALPYGSTWPDLPRPIRLFRPPQPVDVMALLPDHPPVAFTWRRKRHRVRHADGPERIYGEWEKRESELWAVRDYFRLEDEEGRRFWLYRNTDLKWFLHGIY